MMTEETLDDWFAQSINRTIPSMLNPQKKFYIPVHLSLFRIISMNSSKPETLSLAQRTNILKMTLTSPNGKTGTRNKKIRSRNNPSRDSSTIL